MVDNILYDYIAGEVKVIRIDYLPIKLLFKKVFEEENIQPGKYYGQNGRDILRKVQPKLYEIFEKRLFEFDVVEIHKKALRFYSNQLFKKITVDELIRIGHLSSEDRVLKLKECEEYWLPLRLLILLNLCSRHSENAKKEIGEEDFYFLLGMAYELNAIQLNSDAMSENDKDLYLELKDDNIYDFVFSEDYTKRISRIYERKNNYLDFYAHTRCITKQDYDEFLLSFYQDTGVRYDVLTNVLNTLGTESFLSQFLFIESSYYCTNKKYLIGKLTEKLNTEGIENALNFISLDCSKIKFANGQMHDIIPLWERKTRTERIETKPIIELNGLVYLAAPLFYEAFREWGGAFSQLCLPYETGFNNTIETINKLNKKVQYDLVDEVLKIFRNYPGFVADKEIDLHKRDRNAGFPDNLGDYDIIAINERLKIAFVIECKCVSMTKTVHEVYSKDKHFFLDSKNHEKFRKRIEFFNQNYHSIIDSIFHIKDSSNYTIYSIMIFNKVMEPINISLPFDNLSYHEFKKGFLTFIPR